MKIYKLGNNEYWYDRSQGQNVWYCAKFDEEGNQVGDALSAHHKSDIIFLAERNQ